MSNNLDLSKHACQVYRAVCEHKDWIRAKPAAKKADVLERTTRKWLEELSRKGVLEQARTPGGFHYRLEKNPTDEAKELMRRLHDLEAIYGEDK